MTDSIAIPVARSTHEIAGPLTSSIWARWSRAKAPGLLSRSSCVADLGDPAPFQHDEPVGPAERAQAVGDGDRRPALDQVVERLLDLALGLGVDRRGRLVEDQDPRVDQQGPGDRDPLPLAAGERLAALADERVVAVGQPEDELVGPGGAGRGDDLVAAWRRAGRRRCSRRSCRRTGTAPAARCRCCGGIRRPGTSGRRRRRPGSRPRRRRRTGRPG